MAEKSSGRASRATAWLALATLVAAGATAYLAYTTVGLANATEDQAVATRRIAKSIETSVARDQPMPRIVDLGNCGTSELASFDLFEITDPEICILGVTIENPALKVAKITIRAQFTESNLPPCPEDGETIQIKPNQLGTAELNIRECVKSASFDLPRKLEIRILKSTSFLEKYE